MKKVLFALIAVASFAFAEGDKTEKSQPADKAEVASATLSIETEPANVSVFINGKESLTSPFSKKLPAGAYTLIFKKKGYYGKKVKIDLKAGEEHKQSITLRAPGKLILASTPEGATVQLNGEEVGTTPFTSKPIKPGNYSLSISKEGFETYAEKLIFASGQKVDKSITLRAVTPKVAETVLDTVEDTIEDTVLTEDVDTLAVEKEPVVLKGLSLKTTPDSVTVILNDSDTLLTPFVASLPAGEHKLLLKKKGYYAKKVTLTLPKDTLLEKSITLRAPSYITINTNVDSCRVLLNKSDVGFTPFTSKPLKGGTYEIILLKSGYKTVRKSIEVPEGEKVVFDLTLESTESDVQKKGIQIKEEKVDKKERKALAIVAGSVFGVFLTMITAFELSGVGE